MGEHSGTVDSSNSRRTSREIEGSTCRVCKGRKYTLVATRTVNQRSTVYERQACPACAENESIPAADMHKQESHSGKKRLSGTGYLRNKKRRRKEAF